MAKRNYNSDEIVRAVKIIIDENEESAGLAGIRDTDQLQTDIILHSLIPHALNRLAEVAPEDVLADMTVLLDEGASSLHPLGNKGYGKYVIAPDDMLRVVSVYCNDWEQPVREFLTGTEEAYYMQRSPFAGVRGSVYDPVVAVVNNPVGPGTRVELYTTGEDRLYMVYLPDFTAGEGDVSDWDLTGRIYGALLYMIASLYFITIDENDRAEVMAREAAEQLGLTAKDAAR